MKNVNRKWHKFKNNRRGFYSCVVFLALFGVSLFSEFIANDKPLFIRYKGTGYFPVVKSYTEDTFGGLLPTETNYHEPLIIEEIERHGFIVWPPIRFSYQTTDYYLDGPSPAPPSSRHLLGTDDQSRDVVARLLYGFRISVLFGLMLTAASSVIGIMIGAIQGYFGGRIDLLGQRFLEIWGSLPQLFILILVSSVIAPSFFTLLAILLLFSWTSLVQVVRAEFLKTRNLDYVRAAKAMGVPNLVIIMRHVLPNAFVAALTYIPFILSGSITALSALDFLGLGLPPGSASLGDILRQGKENIEAYWLGISGFIALGGLLTLLIFTGEAVRDAFDPRRDE